jgi:hypothetical protein
MRTTLTLDPDVAQRVKQAMAARKLTLKRVINDALRAGLSSVEKPPPAKKFVVEPWSFGFNPGIDLNKLGQFLDDLEVEDFLKKHSR